MLFLSFTYASLIHVHTHLEAHIDTKEQVQPLKHAQTHGHMHACTLTHITVSHTGLTYYDTSIMIILLLTQTAALL